MLRTQIDAIIGRLALGQHPINLLTLFRRAPYVESGYAKRKKKLTETPQQQHVDICHIQKRHWFSRDSIIPCW
jgi:hypothetical protein